MEGAAPAVAVLALSEVNPTYSLPTFEACSSMNAPKAARKACCHLCGSSKGSEASGTAVRRCEACGTCFHAHDCGGKYASKKAADVTLGAFSSERDLVAFRVQSEDEGVECQAYMRKMSNWAHRLQRLGKLVDYGDGFEDDDIYADDLRDYY